MYNFSVSTRRSINVNIIEIKHFLLSTLLSVSREAIPLDINSSKCKTIVKNELNGNIVIQRQHTVHELEYSMLNISKITNVPMASSIRTKYSMT